MSSTVPAARPPVPAGADREAFPDRLRGLALLGIVVVNAPFLLIGAGGLTSQATAAPVDWVAAFLTIALAQGKFYLLFSFLFGYSAAFILRDGHAPDRARFARRLVGLAVIGLAHASLFFVGDILLSYAVLGVALLALYGRSDRTVAIFAWVAGGVATLWLALLVAATVAAPATSLPGSLQALDAALAGGSFAQAAVARVQALPVVLLVLGSLNWGYALAAFALGLLAARRRLLAEPERHRATWHRCAVLGIGIGLPVQVVAALLVLTSVGPSGLGEDPAGVAGVALGFVTAPLLAAGYLGAIGLWLARRPTALAWAGAAGRMSLTLYIGESVVLSLLAGSYGLGVFGRVGAAATLAIAVGTWALLEILARGWLHRRPQGPLESALKWWTNAGTRR